MTTRDLVTIGQRWQKRGPRKHFAPTDRATVRNVYRTDRCVSLVNDAGDRFPVSFDDLRKRWKLSA
jgi:hypothetical protein